MDAFPQTFNPNSVIKQYPYRYSWTSTILLLVAGGIVAWVSGKDALATHSPLTSLAAVIFAILFLFGLYVMVVNLFGNLRLVVTDGGIYVPSVWKWGHSTFIPFSGITHAEVYKMQRNEFFELIVGKRKYPITRAWLPHPGDFDELVDFVHTRFPDVFTPSLYQ